MKWRIIFPFLFLSLVWFAPKIASTGFGKVVAVKTLEVKTKAHIEMQALHLSWFGPQKIEGLQVANDQIFGSCEEFVAYEPLWRLGIFKGLFTIREGYLRVKSPSGEEAVLEMVKASLNSSEFTASGTSRQGDLRGTFAVTGKTEGFPKTFALEGKLLSIPSLFIDLWIPSEYKAAEILGDFFNANGSLQVDGEKALLNLSLSSPNSHLEAVATLDGKMIRLEKPLSASFKLTPALSQTLVKEINPLFLTAVRSQSPVRLDISSENFELPYDPFVFEQLRIESATLDMGRVVVRKGASLQSLLQLLQSRKMGKSEEMNAWFTPVSFQVQDGTLYTGRLDALLADSIHICSWGKVNLLNEKLNMYLGLPADTLNRSFGITGLSSDYVLKIPLRGTISNPDLQSGQAVAQIASMAATQKLPIPKVGKMFEAITKTASQLKNDKDVPPAKRPFPWE